MLSRHAPLHGRAESPAGLGSGPCEPVDMVLDTAALGRLSELDPTGQNHLLERVLQAFRASAARLQPQAVAARASGDRAVLRLVAHTLKSSSASIGALQLSRLCAEIEDAIRLESAEDLGPRLDAMAAALDATLRAIAVRLGAPR